jgi:STE24 endopeptidase
VVLDDTTLARARSDPAAVLAVVAHEFGHVRHQDVVRGTVLGALGSVAAVLLAAWVLTSARGARLFTLSSSRPVETACGVALVMALATTLSVAAAPLSNLVSRRIEASADVHALAVTHDVPAFVRMQHDLAVSNLSRLEPSWWQTVLFATHPDPVWRIAQARTWQQLHR